MAIYQCYFTLYDKTLLNLRLSDLLTNDIKLALTTSAYVVDEALDEFFDVDITNEIAASFGYTAGGILLTTKILDEIASGQYVFSADNISLAATGGAITAHTAILYDDTPVSNKPLLGYGYLDYNEGSPSSVVIEDTKTLFITVPSLGFFYTQKQNGLS